MLREAFKVVINENGKGKTKIFNPFIDKVEITDPDGVSWRDAKKQLRKWYLEQAHSLRTVSKQTYFEEQQ